MSPCEFDKKTKMFFVIEIIQHNAIIIKIKKSAIPYVYDNNRYIIYKYIMPIAPTNIL